jgi:phosphohistidine swiveling domain-containing protein
MEYITKRNTYVQSTYLLASELNTLDKKFPVYIGQVNVYMNDMTEYNWIYKNQSDWQKYLDFYSDNMEIFEKAIKHIIVETVPYIQTEKNDGMQIYFKNVAKILRYSAILRCIDIALQPHLKKILNSEELGIVTMPINETITIKEERTLLELASSKMTNNEKILKLNKIYEDYKWIYYGLSVEKPVTFDEYKSNFFAIYDPQKSLDNLNSRKIKDKIRRDEILKKINLVQKKYIDIAQKSAFLKDYNKFGMDICFALSQSCVGAIAKNTQIPPENIWQLFPQEILDLINGKKFDFNKIKKRNEKLIFVGHPDVYEIISGNDAKIFEKKYLNKENESELKGRIASRGYGKGLAKIIIRRDEFDKMNIGDILVVTNTTPDYVPIIKKAAAIIAEEGGITAHASVVSREFGIPCIVGVSSATQILKDGDIVEVDANKGIIKIIK